jgi:energy-coupling factor transport system ATP-binding protein
MNTKEEKYTGRSGGPRGMVFQNPNNRSSLRWLRKMSLSGPRTWEFLPPRSGNELRSLSPQWTCCTCGDTPRIFFQVVRSSGSLLPASSLWRPRCIIWTNPTAMLDPRGREEVMRTVLDLNRKHGITVIHITHYMDEALYADPGRWSWSRARS